MSHSDDPDKIPTTATQEPPKTLQDLGFLDSDITGMSLSDVPIQNQTQQESHQDSSFLQSRRFPSVSPMNTDEVALNSQQYSFKYPSYFGRPTMNTGGTLFYGNQSNSSLDYGWNMGSQRNTGFTMIPTPGKTGTNNNTNKGETCLNIVEASNKSGSYGTDITEPFGSSNTDPASFQSASASSSSSLCQQQQRFISRDAYAQNHVASDMVNSSEPIYSQIPQEYRFSQFQNRYRNNAEDHHNAGSQIPPATSPNFLTIQQIEQILDNLDLPDMGLDSTNSLSNLSLLNIARSDSGSHGHSQSQSQPHAQMSNSMSNETMSGTGNLFSGNQGNVSPYYRWNMGNTKPIKMMPTPGHGKSNTNNNNYSQFSLSVEAFNNSTNPASFQALYTTSSSLLQQHRVLTEPQWTKILNLSDTDNILHLGINFVQRHILIHLPEQNHQKLRETEPGVMVTVYDHNTNTSHNLYLGMRQQVYILRKGWKKEFVERRRLCIGDQIGFCWDPSDSTLHFSVVSPAIHKLLQRKK